MQIKQFEDDNVIKFVFEFEDAIAEAVQSGCPVGCVFCGTGKKFIRNLTAHEILKQIKHLEAHVKSSEGIDLKDCTKFQIMFMSMGEPMLNYDNVHHVIWNLESDYPDAQFLLSTVGIKDVEVLTEIFNDGYYRNNVGLQFSIYDAWDHVRDEIIPFKNKMTLQEIRDYGIHWSVECEKKVYLNYCVTNNSVISDKLERLMDLFPPRYFAFTFSAICESEEGKASCDNTVLMMKVHNKFLDAGYDVRTFDPAGKDTIGGGCGQLWCVQDYFKKYGK